MAKVLSTRQNGSLRWLASRRLRAALFLHACSDCFARCNKQLLIWCLMMKKKNQGDRAEFVGGMALENQPLNVTTHRLLLATRKLRK